MSEELKYVSMWYDTVSKKNEIAFNFSGGGAAIAIENIDNSDDVVSKLRHLANVIERSVRVRDNPNCMKPIE